MPADVSCTACVISTFVGGDKGEAWTVSAVGAEPGSTGVGVGAGVGVATGVVGVPGVPGVTPGLGAPPPEPVDGTEATPPPEVAPVVATGLAAERFADGSDAIWKGVAF